MGFRPPGAGAKQWHIGGVVTDIYLESRQVVMGSTLFYGFMTLELQVRNGAAEAQPVSLRLHNYYGSYNAGMGRQDEAKQGLMRLLVEGAQETLSQLNRNYFHASPHSFWSGRTARGTGGGVTQRSPPDRAVGVPLGVGGHLGSASGDKRRGPAGSAHRCRRAPRGFGGSVGSVGSLSGRGGRGLPVVHD